MNSANFFGKATQDLEVEGYRIPKGWGAIAAIHITMRSDDVYDDPDRFDPDRFLPDREARAASRQLRAPRRRRARRPPLPR